MRPTCRICDSLIVDLPLLQNLPASSARLFMAHTPEWDCADFTARVCPRCSHVENISYQAADYGSDDYVAKRSVSGTMSANLTHIREWLLGDPRPKLQGLRVLEIGSGSGELAHWFADQGSVIHTVDPSVEGYEHRDIRHTQANFTGYYLATNEPYDIIIVRHVLEHVPDPRELLKLMRLSLTTGAHVYIEVPNGQTSMASRRLMDYFNDHIHHFTATGFAQLAQSAGFRVVRQLDLLQRAHMGFWLEPSDLVEEIAHPALSYTPVERLQESQARFAGIIDKINQAGRVIIYGAGAHAATFTSQLTSEQAAKVFRVWDKDSRKHGRFLPNCSTAISAPGDVTDWPKSGLIINTSVLYPGEVELYLVNELGLGYPIITL